MATAEGYLEGNEWLFRHSSGFRLADRADKTLDNRREIP